MIFDELKPGKSFESRDIFAFQSHFKNQNSKFLYLLAGLHGDELEGIYILNKLFEWLQTDHSMPDLPIIVIPTLNVDGYYRINKENSNGVDLNRNFPTADWESYPNHHQNKMLGGIKPSSEPETKFFMNLLKKYPPSCLISFMSSKPMIVHEGKIKDIATYLSKLNFYDMSLYQEEKNPGGLFQYLLKEHQCPAILFQCPRINDELTFKDIWEHNEHCLKSLFNSDLLAKKINQSI